MNKNFEKWVSNPFTGYQGGGREAKVWFCGIEYGGETSLSDLIKQTNNIPKEFPYEPVNLCSQNLRYSYNQNVYKIAQQFSRLRKDTFFGKDSEIAKLNLFPLSFKTDFEELISEELVEYTGFLTKSAYREFVIKNRFPKMVELTRKMKPKIVLGTSTSHILNYVLAFSGEENLHEKIERIKKSRKSVPQNISGNKSKYIYQLRISEDTLLIVCPFLGGQSGLKSDEELAYLGKTIKKYLDLGS
ncbi:MAG: hypothetical protein CME65_12655 [Halobacteriovoraceae bacterium]|nr:hypothetical protein [Halobacteriovoraceae bacterium]|tara:strand:+ start:15300 stop:16031 length:732 start_codon:yes stop_codon:yes gene_type:complete